MTTYMTWLVPAAGPERDRLTAVMGGLAAEHEAPVFKPHVTMTDPVEADELSVLGVLQPMLSGRAPIQVTLSGFGHEPEFFRSLYLAVEPSEPLTALHDAARQSWEQILPPYRPHLSLLYADLPEEGKDAIAGGVRPGPADDHPAGRGRAVGRRRQGCDGLAADCAAAVPRVGLPRGGFPGVGFPGVRRLGFSSLLRPDAARYAPD